MQYKQALDVFRQHLNGEIRKFQKQSKAAFAKPNEQFPQSLFFSGVYNLYHRYSTALPAATSFYAEEHEAFRIQLIVLRLCLLMAIRCGDRSLLANCSLLLSMCVDTFLSSVYSDFKQELKNLLTSAKPYELNSGEVEILADREITKSKLASVQQDNLLNSMALSEAKKVVELAQTIKEGAIQELQKKVARHVIEQMQSDVAKFKAESAQADKDRAIHAEEINLLKQAVAFLLVNAQGNNPKMSEQMIALCKQIAGSITPVHTPSSESPRHQDSEEDLVVGVRQ